MINTSEKIIWTDTGNVSRSIDILRNLESITAINAQYNGGPVDEIHSHQFRSRIALCILAQKTNIGLFNFDTLDVLYTITTTPSTSIYYLKSLYKKVTGLTPNYIADIEGLKAPLRAMFAILWSEGALTLPFSFRTDGAWQKYPELKEKTQGFVYSLTKDAPSLSKSARSFQYRTNWHGLKDILFQELWEVAPKVIDAQTDIKKSGAGGNLEFSYLSFVKLISETFPQVVSADQCFHLEKYHQHLQQKSRSFTALENRQDFESFREMWGANSEAWLEMTPKERERLRAQKRTHENHARQTLLRKEEAIEARKVLHAEADDLSPEALAVLTRKSVVRVAKNFSWLANGAYIGLEHIDIETLSGHWRAAILLFDSYLDKKEVGARTRAQYGVHVALLMDYLFCYLPLWREANENSLIEIPRFLTDFYRTIYWNNKFVVDLSSSESNTPQNELSKIKNMPLTALDFYLTCYSQKTIAAFISSIHLFFDVAMFSGRDIYIDGEPLIDDMLVNPVSPRLDSPGSGARTKTDKVVLPLASVPIAKEYMLAIDLIGREIRDKILCGTIPRIVQEKIKSSDWIELQDVDIVYTIKLINPNTGDIVKEIKLDRIVNAYAWHQGKYSDNGNILWMPWLSSIRMLTVAMYGGLRLQNCQWLDIRSFDKFYDASSCVLGYNVLYVNTDKNGNSRPVTLSSEVFNCLLDERRFQNSWSHKPVGPVYYENNKKDKNYGEIYPLFRSPFNKSGLPFSDTYYADKWVEILIGIQSIYNSIVPSERAHEFTVPNSQGKLLAVHTPHALRATWITYMTIYGHLPFALTGQQVGHANPKTTVHYTAPTLQQTEEHIRAAEAKTQQASWDVLWGVQPSIKAQGDLQASWQSNITETAKAQGLISLASAVVETDQMGLDLIKVKNVTEIGWYQTCACMLNGKCSNNLLAFTKSPKTCGLCPHAVYGVSHLPAINAKMRSLIDECEALRERIPLVATSQAGSQDLQDLHHLLTIRKLELAGYEQARQILNQHMESEEYKTKYISRFGDFRNCSHEFDNNHPVQRFLANIIDGREYPAFSADNYLIRLKKFASSPHLMSIALASPEERDIIANQIIFMLTNTGITFQELSTRVQEAGVKGIGLAA